MEALSVLGVVDKTADGDGEPGHPETQINLASAFSWFATERCKSLMGRATVTQGGNAFAIQPSTGIKKEFPPCVTVGDGSEPDAQVAAKDLGACLPGSEWSAGTQKLRL